jgi:hypothetical protein
MILRCSAQTPRLFNISMPTGLIAAACAKKNRGRVIERFRAEHGNKRVALLQREHILKMLAAIERPSAKRHWLKAIRGLLRAAVPTMRRDDPTEGIAGIKMPKTILALTRTAPTPCCQRAAKTVSRSLSVRAFTTTKAQRPRRRLQV